MTGWIIVGLVIFVAAHLLALSLCRAAKRGDELEGSDLRDRLMVDNIITTTPPRSRRRRAF